ncbi:MAG: lysylphosphatidylglycerol synthase transmembrane domain-containing protein [Candidatus Nanopelagicales bacterium]
MATSARFGMHDLVRVWSSAADAGRKRRPTDGMLLALAVLVLVVGAGSAPGPGAVDTGISTFLDALPDLVGLLWGLSYTSVTVWAVVLVVLPLFFTGRRHLTLTLLLSGLFALAGSFVVGTAAGMTRDELWSSLLGQPDSQVYPAVRIAVATAIVVAASPWLSRPLRYIGRALVLFAAVGVVGLGVTWAGGAISGFFLGIGAAAVAHLLFGSPQGLLTSEQVEIALSDLGIDATDATPLPPGVGGEAMWDAQLAGGAHLTVRVFGRDAWDSQLIGSVWTALTRRGESLRLGRGRVFRVEHEALAGLMAARDGVPVLSTVAVGRSEQGDALIATDAPTWKLADADSELSDADIDAAWSALLALHRVGMAHGRIGPEAIVRGSDGQVALADFADAELTSDDGDRQVDRVRLLVATALVVGQDRALARARAALGADATIDLLPYLQPAVLSRSQRQAVHDGEWSMKDLQHAAVALAQVEAPPLQQIRRVSAKSIAIVAVVALIAYTLISAFSGVDFASMADALSTADWAWVVLAVLLSPVIQMFFAFSTIGSTLKRLRYVPVLMLQYAIQFIALCLPSTAARLALEVRFFERFGLPAATAIGIGMIDSFSGFLVQISLILLILVSGLPGFTSAVRGTTDATASDGSSPGPLLVVAVFTLIAVLVTFAVPRLRHRLLGSVPRIKARIAEQRKNAGDALLVIRHPRKVATMLLGNLGAQVMQALVLGVCLAAFGETAHLSQLILINTAVSLFAGLMPVPGGMGVAEAGYTAGLQAIGVPPADAVSTAVAFRLATFYLPPLWGSVSMRWLRRHEYV